MDLDLSSFTLDVLLDEPARLERSISSLKSQFDTSMASNYDFFIKTCATASTITDDLESCASSLSDLTISLDSAVSQCGELCLCAQRATESNAKISSAFRHLPQISEILDIPQLMRTCRISGFYEEALQLFSAVERFARQYPGIASIQATLEEARVMKNDVAQTLIDTFGKEISLPDAIQAVALLRRAGVHSEAQLRLAFVNGRRRRMQAEIDGITHYLGIVYFENLTKIYRTSLYEICTWYKSLFNGEDAEDDLTLHLLFQHEIQIYCNELRKRLDELTDEGDARSIMESALYFMNSLGKVGFDFSPLLEYEFYQTKWGKKM